MKQKSQMKLPEDGCNAVQEIGGEVEHDGELGELLEELPRGEGRVVGGPAADQQKPAAPLRDGRTGVSILRIQACRQNRKSIVKISSHLLGIKAT